MDALLQEIMDKYHKTDGPIGADSNVDVLAGALVTAILIAVRESRQDPADLDFGHHDESPIFGILLCSMNDFIARCEEAHTCPSPSTEAP